MKAKQRVYGPFFPSHTLESYATDQNTQLNHWCEEMEQCEQHQQSHISSSDTRTQIMKAAPISYID